MIEISILPLPGVKGNLYNQYEEKVQPALTSLPTLYGPGRGAGPGPAAIAVIGDQSSGKSSVLGLSGVALPRGSGKHLPSVLVSSGCSNRGPQTWA